VTSHWFDSSIGASTKSQIPTLWLRESSSREPVRMKVPQPVPRAQIERIVPVAHRPHHLATQPVRSTVVDEASLVASNLAPESARPTVRSYWPIRRLPTDIPLGSRTHGRADCFCRRQLGFRGRPNTSPTVHATNEKTGGSVLWVIEQLKRGEDMLYGRAEFGSSGLPPSSLAGICFN
jgi:hypothetical protein